MTHATRVAGMELGRYGVRVNSISPGTVAAPSFLGGSDTVKSMDPGVVDAQLERMARFFSRTTPLQRSGSASEVAAAAVFLASDESSYINCHDLIVDGRMTAGGRNDFEQTSFEATSERLREAVGSQAEPPVPTTTR